MGFGFAGAGAGASQALEEILAQQMVRAQLAQRQLEQAEQTSIQQQEQTRRATADADDRQFRQQQVDRQGQIDREQSNTKGVRRMIGEAMQQRTPLADMQGMAFSEGIDLPQEAKPLRQTVTTIGKRGEPVKRLVSEDELETGVPEYREPKEPRAQSRPGTHVIDGKLVDDNGRVIYAGSGKNSSAGGGYTADKASDTIRKINDLIGDPDDPSSKSRITKWTAGVGGSMLAKAPFNTPARNVNAELESLAASIAFNQLQKMRDASKTGGALGNVALGEMELLKNAEASIRQDQSPDNLTRQLGFIRDSEKKFLNASGGLDLMRPVTSRGAAPSGPKVGETRTIQGRQATWDGRGWVAK